MKSRSLSSPNLAIVITTFRRQDLLEKLLESIDKLTIKPRQVIVVDNENSPATKKMVRRFKFGKYVPMSDNTGGAGGFSRGVHEAYDAGFDWLWLMDDDVKVLPRAVEKLAKWTAQTDHDLAHGKTIAQTVGVFQPQRKNFDNSPFYWQYHFLDKFIMPNPIAPSRLKKGETTRPMNTACFEGSLFHRDVIKAVGLPDARYFIYWDDTTYGYLASKITQMKLVPDFALQRTRTLDHVKVGRVRKLNATSDMTRYYIMRNRAHFAHYLRANGDYNPLCYGLGTLMTFSKEVIRLFITKNFRSGFGRLWRGWRDSRPILHGKDWQPFADIEPIK
jgi:GT2 family glycosyltransferase